MKKRIIIDIEVDNETTDERIKKYVKQFCDENYWNKADISIT